MGGTRSIAALFSRCPGSIVVGFEGGITWTGNESSEAALYSMAIRSNEDKRRTCPYLEASQVSNPSKNQKCKCSILLRNRSFDSSAYNAHRTLVCDPC
jgi:hypothetical protein